MSNWIETQYLHLLEDILEKGVEKKDRTGTGTLSVFGHQIRHNMKDGFPLLTTKKMAWKTMVTELLWFLRGDTNIKYLVDNGCNIWNGDTYQNYLKNFTPPKCPPNLDVQPDYYEPMSKEVFIYGIKTDDEFAKKWGELGKIYGKQWRSWGRKNVTNYDLKDVKGSDQPKVLEAIKNGEDVTKYGVKIEYQNNSIDQIENLINELKTNPDSRRLMVNAWNVGELDQMVLPPCHYGFQVYTRELSLEERKVIAKKVLPILNTFLGNQSEEGWIEQCEKLNIPTRAISLMWNQRSVDTGLGLSFNIASYSLLLMMIAKQVNMVPDQLIGNLGDCHIYLNQIDGVKEQLTREPYPLPTVKISDRVVNDISEYTLDDIILENYQSHPTIKMPLSN
jgi:thymidylate synthase